MLRISIVCTDYANDRLLRAWLTPSKQRRCFYRKTQRSLPKRKPAKYGDIACKPCFLELPNFPSAWRKGQLVMLNSNCTKASKLTEGLSWLVHPTLRKPKSDTLWQLPISTCTNLFWDYLVQLKSVGRKEAGEGSCGVRPICEGSAGRTCWKLELRSWQLHGQRRAGVPGARLRTVQCVIPHTQGTRRPSMLGNPTIDNGVQVTREQLVSRSTSLSHRPRVQGLSFSRPCAEVATGQRLFGVSRKTGLQV